MRELWRSYPPNEREFLSRVVFPLVALILVAPVLLVWSWSSEWAYLVGWGGTIMVFVGNLLWIVFVDSKRRWPGVKAFDRYARVFTFYRD